MEVSYWSIGMSKLKTPGADSHPCCLILVWLPGLALAGASHCSCWLVGWHGMEGSVHRGLFPSEQRGPGCTSFSTVLLTQSSISATVFPYSYFHSNKISSFSTATLFQMLCSDALNGWRGGRWVGGEGNINNIILRPQEQRMRTRRDPESDVLWTGSG